MKKVAIVPNPYLKQVEEAVRLAGLESKVLDGETIGEIVQQAAKFGATHLVMQRRAYLRELGGIDQLAIGVGINVIIIGTGQMDPGYYHPGYYMVVGHVTEQPIEHLIELLTGEPTGPYLVNEIQGLDQQISRLDELIRTRDELAKVLERFQRREAPG